MTNNKTRREAILAGTLAAAELHKEIDMQRRVASGIDAIDVYGEIAALDIPLLFKDLDGLLGLCLTEPAPGILINQNRPAMMKRFTAAHELGHLRLKHQGSLDRQIFEIVSDQDDSREPEEIQADAFASEFLFPKWLLIKHLNSIFKERQDVGNPQLVYELSLRIGGSYQAVVYALESHKFITMPIRRLLLSRQPSDIKKSLLETSEPLGTVDVKRLFLEDSDKTIEVRSGDYILVELPEMAAAGYIWEIAPENESVLQVLNDQSSFSTDSVGAEGKRKLIFSVKSHGETVLKLVEKRPWEANSVARAFKQKVIVLDPYLTGLPDLVRKVRLGVVPA